MRLDMRSLQALFILWSAPLSLALGGGENGSASSAMVGSVVVGQVGDPRLAYQISKGITLRSRFLDDADNSVLQLMDKALKIHNLTATTALVCEPVVREIYGELDVKCKDDAKRKQLHRNQGGILKSPYQNTGVLCTDVREIYSYTYYNILDVTELFFPTKSETIWEFVLSSDKRTCDYNCDCGACWDEALCPWMESANITRETLIERGGAFTGKGVLCKLQSKRWEHIVKGNERICNGYNECLNGLDEDDCPVIHIKVDSLEANISRTELKKHRGAHTHGGIICKDFERNWIAISKSDPRLCDGINDCFSSMPTSLDEENCGTFQVMTQIRRYNVTRDERHGTRKGAFRDDGLVCEDKEGKWTFIGFSDSERCDGLFTCESGLDEANCTDLLGKVPVLIALGIFVVCLLVHMLRDAHYQYTGGSTEDFARKFAETMRTPLDEAVDTLIEAAQTKGQTDQGTDPGDPEKSASNDILEASFSEIHKAEAGSRLLIGTGFTFLLCPNARHWLANFILEQEKRIHHDNQEELLTCLRQKAASNAGTTEFFDAIQPPGSLTKANLRIKTMVAKLVATLIETRQDKETSLCGSIALSAKSTFLRGFWPLLKTNAYLMDYIKDGCFFAYLLQRFKFILNSCSFLRGLIVFHGVSVISSGVIVGLAIQDRKTIVNLDRIQNVYVLWLLRFLFFVCTPFMPLAVIFMAISLTGEKKRLEATWRKTRDTSASLVWKAYDAVDSQKKKVVTLFSYMKTIEANTEASPQLFSLLVFIIASMMLPTESGLTFGLDDSFLTWPFLMFSLLQSY